MSADDVAVKAEGRSRRGSEEVRQAILDSARGLFARKGFGETSMREIAEDAGVYEPMIYRRFESKVGLFEAAVLETLQQALSTHLAEWESPDGHGSSTVEDLVETFLPPLYQLMREHRELFVALMSAEEFYADEIAGRHGSFSVGIRRFVERMRNHIAFEGGQRPFPDVDAARILVISFGMVLGLSLVEGALRPEGEGDLGGEPLVDEMVRFARYGVCARPDPIVGESADLTALFERIADTERRAVRAEVELAHLKEQLARREELAGRAGTGRTSSEQSRVTGTDIDAHGSG